jgi:hypothetical protein
MTKFEYILQSVTSFIVGSEEVKESTKVQVGFAATKKKRKYTKRKTTKRKTKK